ncbi:MAG: Uma2 family endonuclease [Pseudomonadota bacterium]
MQDHRPETVQPATTQAADGYPRRVWTVDELLRLLELGFFDGDGIHRERVELIEGELVARSPKGPLHEDLRSELLINWLRRPLPRLKIASESPVYLSGISAPGPDICVYPAEHRISEVPPAEIILLVEIASTSSRRDHLLKAPVYAKSGIREYWVIDAAACSTTIYTRPGDDGYGSTVERAKDDMLTPSLAPELAICLAQIIDDS